MMRSKFIIFTGILFAGVPLVLVAITTDDGFTAGSTNIVPSGANSLAVGDQNEARRKSASIGEANFAIDRSMSVGLENSSDEDSLSVGSYGTSKFGSLTVGDYNSCLGFASCAIGTGNSSESSDTFLIGIGNSTHRDDELGHRNVLIGEGNFINERNNCILLGKSNEAIGNDSMALGQHLMSTSETVVLGRYNYYAGASGSEVLVVGCGDSASTRKNALEVHVDGSVIINKPQGDISMGAYQ